MASSVADDRDEENMAKGPFIAVAVTSQTDAGEWHVMRTARTGEVATTVSPFRRAVTVPPQRAGDSGLLFSIWHRVSQVGASTTEQGAAESQQLAPELVVHGTDSWSMFKPSGENSVCNSLHGPRCVALRDKFAADSALEEVFYTMAAQPELAWWSAGSSREKALLKLVQNTNRNAASGSLAAMAAIGRQRQSERQQTNSSDLQYGASEPPQRYAASVTTVPRPESVVQREVLLRLLGTEGAQCCLLVDHTRRQHCDACRRYYVVPWLQRMAVDGVPGYSTWRLMLDLVSRRARNVYVIFGDGDSPMRLPKGAFNTRAPFAADLGGVHSSLISLSKAGSHARYDSWLSIGPTEGNPSGMGLGSVGINFDRLGRQELHLNDSAVFWMNPTLGPRGRSGSGAGAAGGVPVVVAQITLPSDTEWRVVMSAQGREEHYPGEDTADWVERNLTWAVVRDGAHYAMASA